MDKYRLLLKLFDGKIDVRKYEGKNYYSDKNIIYITSNDFDKELNARLIDETKIIKSIIDSIFNQRIYTIQKICKEETNISEITTDELKYTYHISDINNISPDGKISNKSLFLKELKANQFKDINTQLKVVEFLTEDNSRNEYYKLVFNYNFVYNSINTIKKPIMTIRRYMNDVGAMTITSDETDEMIIFLGIRIPASMRYIPMEKQGENHHGI